MSQSDRCRWLSVAPLAGVERQGRGSLGSGSLAVGISNSLPSGSRFIQGTHPFAAVLSQLDQGQSSGGRGPVLAGQRSDRACSSSLSGLLQPVVCSSESLRSVEAGHRPLASESEGAADILQDGDSPVCTSVSARWRLDGVSRLEGCVLAGSDVSEIAQASGSWWEGRCTSSRFFALDSPPHLRFSPGSWLLFPLFFTGLGCVYVVT